jgi:hypothetical protein
MVLWRRIKRIGTSYSSQVEASTTHKVKGLTRLRVEVRWDRSTWGKVRKINLLVRDNYTHPGPRDLTQCICFMASHVNFQKGENKVLIWFDLIWFDLTSNEESLKYSIRAWTSHLYHHYQVKEKSKKQACNINALIRSRHTKDTSKR